MASITVEQLKELAAQYLANAKIADPTYTPTVDDLTNLVNKISDVKVVTQDYYASDNLPELDGDLLPYGTVIEEWFSDLLAAEYGGFAGGEADKAPSTFRPATYSEQLKPWGLEHTIENYKMQKVSRGQADFAALMAQEYSKVADSREVTRYAHKLELLGKVYDLIDKAITGAATYGATTAYNPGQYVKSGDDVGVVFKKKTAASKAWDAAIKDGTVVKLNLVSSIAEPGDDSASGQAFLTEAINTAIRANRKVHDGDSLWGNTLGKAPQLVLYLKDTLQAKLSVYTEAGAFHLDKLAMPENVVVKYVPDFGKGRDKLYGLMVDPRGVKNHTNYHETLSKMFLPHNGMAFGYIKMTDSNQETDWISPNVFVHAFVNP